MVEGGLSVDENIDSFSVLFCRTQMLPGVLDNVEFYAKLLIKFILNLRTSYKSEYRGM